MSGEPARTVSGLGTRLSRRRQLYGLIVALVAAPAVTVLLLPWRDQFGVDTVLLFFMLVSVTASAVGGIVPAAVGALLSFGLANYFFTPPYGSLWVQNRDELVDLVIFLAVAATVGIVTELGARARGRAERSLVEAEWLADLGGREDDPNSVNDALTEICVVYGMNAALLQEDGRTLASAGTPQPDDHVLTLEAGERLGLELHGPEHIGQDRTLLDQLAATTGRLWRTQQLAERARRGEELARVDELRSSLLAAVGHDLRNPLAAISAAAATLAEPDLALEPDERTELLATITGHTERLNRIIGNLLDASRLQAGALSAHPAPTDLLDVLAPVMRLGPEQLDLDLPDDLPLVLADPGLLERVLANLVDNAARHAGEGEVVLRAGVAAGGRRVTLAVIDHGPGVAPERMAEVFAPFQHFGDRTSGGLGLGLAIARGFTEAMGGTLTGSATAGGGLTMTVTLEVADAPAADR